MTMMMLYLYKAIIGFKFFICDNYGHQASVFVIIWLCPYLLGILYIL